MPRSTKSLVVIPESYGEHKERWLGCDRCVLATRHRRKKVCLLRGNVPARVLFVGEAPGESENVLGRPFVGPAGQLLEEIVHRAGIPKNAWAVTYLVGCIPLDEEGDKIASPTQFPESITTCRPRLVEAMFLVRPELVIWVGKDAAKHGPRALDIFLQQSGTQVSIAEMFHPAYLLRLDVTQKSLAIQRTIIAVRDAYSTIHIDRTMDNV